MTVVHLVRHGEVYNPDGVLYSRLPGFHLSDVGVKMARVVGDYFKESELTYIGASPLERAQETAAEIATHHPEFEVGTIDDVIEADSEFRGQVFGPGNQALRKPSNWKLLIDPITPSWAEPYRDIAARMLTGIRAAAELAGDGGEAVVVSHQLPIEIARRAVTGKRFPHLPGQRRCTLASITTFEVDDGAIGFVDYVEPALGLIPPKDRKQSVSSGTAKGRTRAAL